MEGQHLKVEEGMNASCVTTQTSDTFNLTITITSSVAVETTPFWEDSAAMRLCATRNLLLSTRDTITKQEA